MLRSLAGGIAIMLKLLFTFLIFLPFLAGCGRTLVDEAHEQARHAFESGDYSRGSLLLAAGCDTLHSQSIYLLHMIHYQSAGDVFGVVASWSNIRALDARYGFVEDASNILMQEFVYAIHPEEEDQKFVLYFLN